MANTDTSTGQPNSSAEALEARNGHKAAVVWLTGLSGAGKSTIAAEVHRRLFEQSVQTFMLDGDQLRQGLNKDLGFTAADRTENIRRAGEVAALFYQSGAVVICSFISPFRADRELAKSLIPAGRFLEVFIDCSLEECARRDPKSLYKKAFDKAISNFTGITSPYERPEHPDLIINTEQHSIEQSVDLLMELLRTNALL